MAVRSKSNIEIAIKMSLYRNAWLEYILNNFPIPLSNFTALYCLLSQQILI